MNMHFPKSTARHIARNVLLLGLAGVLVGCDSPNARFVGNMVYLHRQERTVGETLSPDNVGDVADALEALFGTPDDPHVPVLSNVDAGTVLDVQKLRMAAGPVASDVTGRPQGLYREHCAHCHGITGDGMGPTAAFLNPYPRDFRAGVFKFKSTPKGEKPTHDDLRQILQNGIAGTAMPSFRLLDNDQLEALVDYVKYLSLRGEVERSLIYEASDLDSDERLVDVSLQQKDPESFSQQLDRLKDVTGRIVQRWQRAADNVTEIPARPAGWNEPETLERSIRHGRELFFGAVANCMQCHGDTALGDGQTTDFDDWTKEIDPDNAEALAEYLRRGALHPRTIMPRNLRTGVYRGGRRPVDLYWRILNGIDGTPMPAASLRTEQNPKGLSSEDIWSLIDYVRNLPEESISKPEGLKPALTRDRPL